MLKRVFAVGTLQFFPSFRKILERHFRDAKNAAKFYDAQTFEDLKDTMDEMDRDVREILINIFIIFLLRCILYLIDLILVLINCRREFKLTFFITWFR